MSSSEESNEEIEEKREETSNKEEEKEEKEEEEDEEVESEAEKTIDLKVPITDAGQGILLEADFLQKPFVLNDLECCAIFSDHTQPVRWVLVHNNLLFSSSDDALIKVWDLDMKCCIDTWKGHQDSVCHMSLRNNRLYTASWDKTVRVWDADTGKCLHVLSGHQEVVFQVICDGKRIYSASVDRTIRVWDDISGKCEDVWKGHKTRVLSLVFYEDKVISSSMTEIIIWDKSDGKIIKEIDVPATRCMLVKGNHLFIGQDWYQWRVYDLVAHETIVPEIEWEPVQCMSMDDSGKLYLCSSFSENISVWAPDEEKASSYKMVADIPAHRGPTNCVLYHNGIIISASNDKTIKLWSKKSITPATTIRGHKSEIDCMELWGNYAITASLDGTIRKWDLATNKCVGQFIGHEDMIFQMVCVDEYLISCSYDKQVRVWDIVECKYLWTMRHSDPVNCLIEKEEFIYTATNVGKIYKWKISTSKLVASCGDETIGKTKWMILHEDHLYITSDNGLYKVSINTADDSFGKIIKSYEASEYFNALQYIGNSLYVGTENGCLTEWDPETFTPIRVIQTHTKEDCVVNFFPLGNILYECGNDGLLKIIDLPSGKTLYTCKLHEDGVRDMRISSDRVFTVGLDESLIVWDMTLLLNPALTSLLDKDYRAEHPNWMLEADINGRTPLMAMAAHGMLEIDAIMKEIPGISILETNKLGESIVYFAIKNRHWNLVKLWKERPEMKNIFTDTSNTALQSLLAFTSAHDDNEFFQSLWTSSGTRPTVDLLALAFIRSQPRLKLLETALNTYDMLNKKSKKNKKTLLHYCALFGAPNAVNLLLERELLKANEEDSDRNSPLHLCFTVDEFIDHEFEEELIRKAAPNARHMIIMDRLRVAKILLERADDKNIHMLNKNKYGLKAYHCALKQYEHIRSDLRQESTDHEAVAWKTEELQMITEVMDMFHQQPAISHYRERFAWTTFWKQAVPYAIWLIFLSLVCVHQSVTRMNPSGFYMSEHVGELIGDYGSVQDIPTFWAWVTGSLVPGLESQNWRSPNLDPNLVGGGLRMIGAAQMVQVRVPQHSCYIPAAFKPSVNNCIAEGYDLDKTSYGPGGKYQYDSEAGFWFYGTSGTLYHAGGFVYTMSPDSTVNLPQITSLMNDSWVDSSTRAISVSFSLYSPGLRFYGMVDIVFEFSASGKVLSNLNLQTMKAFPYTESYDYFLLFLELVVILYFIKEFPYQECKEIYQDKIAYIKDIGNYMEWAISALFIIAVILRIMSVVMINNLNLDPATGEYVNLWNLGRIMYANQSFLAMFMLMAWIRTLKLLKILPDTGPAAISILETMKYNSFVVFILICILIVIGLTLSFHASVGMYVDSLSTFGDAFITMVRAAVFGDFDYDSISPHPTGIILYFILKLFFSTLLLTIFIAVISEIYMSLQKANEDRYNLSLTKMLVEYVNNNKKSTIWRRLFKRLRRKPARSTDIQLVVESENVELKALDDSEVDSDDDEHESDVRQYDNEQLDELVLKFAQKRHQE